MSAPIKFMRLGTFITSTIQRNCIRNILTSSQNSNKQCFTASNNLFHLRSLQKLHTQCCRTFASRRYAPYSCSISQVIRTSKIFKTGDTYNCCLFQRSISNHGGGNQQSNRTALIYVCAVGIFMVGVSYAGVPLYRIFCQATGLGGQATQGHAVDQIELMEPVKDRVIRIKFNADIAASMQWNFRPQQTEVKVLPGETALAFYKAKNPTDKPIIGISTYNIVPFEAGQYFNKIQCFCFEEQRLNPHEEVDMPVFFYIDPEFAEDPKLNGVNSITLSYTFFEAKEGLQIPLPGYMQHTPSTA